MSKRDSASPETLAELYQQLKKQELHAESIEPTNLYSKEGLSKAQAEFNYFIGRGKKPDA